MLNKTIKIALLGCTKSKYQENNRAIDIYKKSAFFKKELSYINNVLHIPEENIFILSAKHHLLKSSDRIDYYNAYLGNFSKSEWINWSQITKKQIDNLLWSLSNQFNPNEVWIYVLAGTKYYSYWINDLKKQGYNVIIPAEGLSIGKKLQWFDNENNKIKEISNESKN